MGDKEIVERHRKEIIIFFNKKYKELKNDIME
jgi:hypothetical protein